MYQSILFCMCQASIFFANLFKFALAPSISECDRFIVIRKLEQFSSRTGLDSVFIFVQMPVRIIGKKFKYSNILILVKVIAGLWPLLFSSLHWECIIFSTRIIFCFIQVRLYLSTIWDTGIWYWTILFSILISSAYIGVGVIFSGPVLLSWKQNFCWKIWEFGFSFLHDLACLLVDGSRMTFSQSCMS